jgi:hypothetical protein
MGNSRTQVQHHLTFWLATGGIEVVPRLPLESIEKSLRERCGDAATLIARVKDSYEFKILTQGPDQGGRSISGDDHPIYTTSTWEPHVKNLITAKAAHYVPIPLRGHRTYGSFVPLSLQRTVAPSAETADSFFLTSTAVHPVVEIPLTPSWRVVLESISWTGISAVCDERLPMFRLKYFQSYPAKNSTAIVLSKWPSNKPGHAAHGLFRVFVVVDFCTKKRLATLPLPSLIMPLLE